MYGDPFNSMNRLILETTNTSCEFINRDVIWNIQKYCYIVKINVRDIWLPVSIQLFDALTVKLYG